MDSPRAPHGRDEWKDANDRGLALAEAGDWPQAGQAFAQAHALLAESAPGTGISLDEIDQARALLFSNLAQAELHCGRPEEARRFSERSCSLRVALFGENALSVARARNDLAVVLRAGGHTNEPLSLLQRAIAAVELKLGNENDHLVPLLQNAARIMVSANREADAEPYARRLQALLTTLGAATQPADELLPFIGSARDDSDAPVLFMPTPPATFHATPLASDNDDFPLRDAIALTSDLLRSTPTSNVPIARDMRVADSASIMDSLPEIELACEDTAELLSAEHSDTPDGLFGETHTTGFLDPLDLDEALDETWNHALVQPKTALSATTNQKMLQDVTFDLVELPPPTLNAIPRTTPSAPRMNPLGFAVEYGIPMEHHEPLAAEHAGEGVSERANEGAHEGAHEESVGGAAGDIPHEIAAEAKAPNSREPVVRPMRAVGGIRRGRAQVAELERLRVAAIAIAAFIVGVAAVYWLAPLFR
jgi:hypothetical protein